MQTSLVLRSCDENLQSRDGFQWNGIGETTTAPDWEPSAECRYGLHGWLYGVGNASASIHLDVTSKWMVLEVETNSIIDLGGKCKFPSAETLFIGNMHDAAAFLVANEPNAKGQPVIGLSCTSGDRGTSTSGYKGTSTSGDCGTSTSGAYGTSITGCDGTSTSGEYGTSTSGDRGTSTSGARGTSTSGYKGTSTSGYNGTSTSGEYGTSTSGYKGTSTSGDYGTSMSGNHGTSTSGEYGTSMSGNHGTSMSGNGGTIQIKYWDAVTKRYKIKIGYIGEKGLLPNVAYKLNKAHKFVPA